MKEEYRERIYKSYIAAMFESSRRNISNQHILNKEYETQFKYFKKNYLKYLPADKSSSILDAGCGLGHFLYATKKLGYNNILGIDISQELIEYCKKQGLPAIRSEIIDYLSCKRVAYDTIILNDLIEHFYKHEIIEILDVIYNSLKPGGVLILKTPNMNGPLGLSGRYIDFTHEVGFTESSLKEVLYVTNFRKIEIIGLDIYVSYLNPLNYAAKLFAFILSNILFILSWIYGRTSLRIFDKNLLAIAYKI